jgi:HTH-type transcriptional regulator / antitoxin HigA
VQGMRTLDEVTEEYFRNHPEEIDDYLTEIFQDYAEDDDTGALLASLRIIARVRGVSEMAETTGMTRQGLRAVVFLILSKRSFLITIPLAHRQ